MNKIPYDPRPAYEAFAVLVDEGMEADTAFIAMTKVIASFPHKYAELPELVRAYDEYKRNNLFLH